MDGSDARHQLVAMRERLVGSLGERIEGGNLALLAAVNGALAAARASGDAEPIRVFDTAEDALRCLASLDRNRERPARRLPVQQPLARHA